MLGEELGWQPGGTSGRPELDQPELCGRLALLRRPFSLAGRGEDERGTWVEVIHRVVGTGTSWLADLKPGDAVDFIGPLGNAFTLPPGKSIGLLVGGGVGLPPMFYLAEALHTAGWKAVGFVGALSRDLLAVTFEEGAKPASDGSAAAQRARSFHGLVFRASSPPMTDRAGCTGRITTGLERFLKSQTRGRRGPDRGFHLRAGPDDARGGEAGGGARGGVPGVPGTSDGVRDGDVSVVCGPD